MFNSGFKTRSAVLKRHARVPSASPSATENGAATTITDRVSIAHCHWPIRAIHTKVPPARVARRLPPKAWPTTAAVAATTPGVDGSYRLAGTGALLSDTSNGELYANTSTTSGSPTWTVVGTQS